jgi:hypothetical protein
MNFVIDTGLSFSYTAQSATLAATITLPSYDVIFDASMTAASFNNTFYFYNNQGQSAYLNNTAFFTTINAVSYNSNGNITPFPLSFSNGNFVVDPSSSAFLSSVNSTNNKIGNDFLSYLYALSNNVTTTNGFSNFSNYSTYISSLHTALDASLNASLQSITSGYYSSAMAAATIKPIALQIATQLVQNMPSRFSTTLPPVTSTAINSGYNVSTFNPATNSFWGLCLPGDNVYFVVNITTSPTQKNVINQTVPSTTRKYLIRLKLT